MKKQCMIAAIAALSFAACKNENGGAETKTTAAPEASGYTMPDSATMMKNWQEYMTPGDMHQMMASWNGTWDSEVSMWMEPGAEPQVSTSVSENKMIMNGLYQQSHFRGEFTGMPFEGMSLLAYDNFAKEFISTWIDNMGSGMMITRGTWDDATKTITLKGNMTDPGTKNTIAVRETMKIVDENTQEMEMFITSPDGSEFKTMHIRYTRKK